MLVEQNLAEMERAREAYWRAYPKTSPYKLRWRAMTVKHCFHVLPGETILEVGAGSGLWTEHLSAVLKNRNPIVAAIFNRDFEASENWKRLSNVEPRFIRDLETLPPESFDYVVGTAILCHNRFPENLKAILRLLKPGGQILFFENNLLNPQVFLKNAFPAVGRAFGNAKCQVGMRKFQFLRNASHQGFVEIDVIPYDIIHPRLPKALISRVQSLAFVFEQAPLIRDLCGTLYLWASKPGLRTRPPGNLARHPQFRRAVSFVVPAHNEEMNVGPLVDAIFRYFDDYVHEIVIVNDNSRDSTAEVTRTISQRNPRVRLVDRKPPNGVGRALRDGYAAATGEFILTMDCDFVQIIPEMEELFDAVAAGYDGAVGSRFTHESIMVNYPFSKTLCNRVFHLIANLALPYRIGDISNNLKLFRSPILKEMEIKQDHFAANAEIGLKAIANGYRVREVAISWINRTVDMGSSSFRILKVGPSYLMALLDVIRSARHLSRRDRRSSGASIRFDPRA
jgi:dolichol-phosphate mannosyltransferase